MLLQRTLRLAPLVLGFALCANAQNSASPLPNAPTPAVQSPDGAITLRNTPRHFLEDQEAIWTSPVRIRESNATGPAVLVLVTTLLITTDHQIMSSPRLIDPSLNNDASTASNGLLGGFVAAPALIYGMGRLHHDDYAIGTGILGGEAMTDSLVVDEVMKLVSLRERPTVDNARGKFFQSSVGTDSSFPSTHCMIAWSSAAAIASQYNGPLTKITAYGLATGISATRILARQHFPSDVLVGSAVGWMIGRYVVHRHHVD